MRRRAGRHRRQRDFGEPLASAPRGLDSKAALACWQLNRLPGRRYDVHSTPSHTGGLSRSRSGPKREARFPRRRNIRLVMADPTSPPLDPQEKSPTRPLAGFERALFSTRFVALFAVVGSLAAALAMFYVATMDAVYLVTHLASYADPALSPAARQALHTDTLSHVVEVIDGYLLASILLIFTFGLYELFISPLEAAKASKAGETVLVIRDLDDLKGRLGKVDPDDHDREVLPGGARRRGECSSRPLEDRGGNRSRGSGALAGKGRGEGTSGMSRPLP